MTKWLLIVIALHIGDADKGVLYDRQGNVYPASDKTLELVHEPCEYLFLLLPDGSIEVIEPIRHHCTD